MGNITTCPYCYSDKVNLGEPEVGKFTYYSCMTCGSMWVANNPPTPDNDKYVITREESNQLFTEKQAIKVAEKLALQNPQRAYYISKVTYKSKAVPISAITTKING